MMSCLIKLGADPLLANTSGRTPMQLLALKVTMATKLCVCVCIYSVYKYYEISILLSLYSVSRQNMREQ